jgi:DhnA family fructose-bisphosphate aldolase class Ia
MVTNNSVPADVPKNKTALFKKNYTLTTASNGHVFMFAADQKIEHLNADFYGSDIAPEAHDPERLFKLAAQLPISVFATQLGMIARYGKHYPTINYVAKLNSKTNIISTEHEDPISRQLWSVADVVNCAKNSTLTVSGIGYTLYLGSLHESLMLQEAAQAIFQAHQEGLLATLWIYPRSKYVKQNSAELVAGAAGVANALGADFVKLALPTTTTHEEFAIAVRAAGNTGVIYAGGAKISDQEFVQRLSQYTRAGAAGIAVGRNIFQRSTREAQQLATAIDKLLRTKK